MAFARIVFDKGTIFLKKIQIILVIFLACFGVIILRLFELQIIKKNIYEQKARENQEQKIIVPAERGEIFDCTYNPQNQTNAGLAVNEYSMDIYLIPGTLTKKEIVKTVSNLSYITTLPYENLISKISNILSDKIYLKYTPVKLIRGINKKDLQKIAENSFILPGIIWQNTPKRVYPYKNLACHILGYVGKISPDEWNVLKNDALYNKESIVGKMGIEHQYDRELRGIDGEIIRIVDAQNQIKDTIPAKEPVPGHKIILTINKKFQEIAETVLKGETGTIIISKPKTGEILAMASSPGFDPNEFIEGITEDKYKNLIEKNSFPFLNRAISAKYPPSSTFKIIVQTAALEEEVVSPSDRYLCEGHFELGEDAHIYRCWGIHGWVDAVKALAVSCDIYYYNVGYMLGSEKISHYSRLFGLGEKTGIDLPSESAGFIPSHSWKRRTFREAWYDGDTVNMAIGQGFLLVTPIQMLDVINAVANNGVIYKPFIVKYILNSLNNRVERVFNPQIHRNIPLSSKNLSIIREGLTKAMTYGTGAKISRISRIKVIGKTGTAQLHKGDPHSWFIGYTPENLYDEQYSIVTFIEHGGGGGEKAVPIAIAALQSIIRNENPAELKRYFLHFIEESRFERLKKIQQEKQDDDQKSNFPDVSF